MYMPGQTGQIRRFGLRRVWLRRIGTALGLGIAVLSVGFVDYVRVRRTIRELPALRSESQQQREQILEYARKLEEISGHLQRVAELDRKLRVITNLDPADPIPLPGVGGLDDGMLETSGLARLNRQRYHRGMLEKLSQLSGAAAAQAGNLQVLVAHLEDQTVRLSNTPSVAPTKGWITSGFGYRTSPFTGLRELHRGLDIAGRMKTPILAPADGQVVTVADRGNIGITITIRHGYGIETIYGHLSEALVQLGQDVSRGDRIGLMGNTGRSTGPHLHYQVQVNGRPVDPQNYILDES
jgi:murein DD-endopeptidase MepM/ murein hydrolase activator NlpD